MEPYASKRELAWHFAYCRWYDRLYAGHHIRATLWGIAADLLVKSL